MMVKDTIDFEKSVTLDLNGNTIEKDGKGDVVIINKSNLDVAIKNGSLVNNDNLANSMNVAVYINNNNINLDLKEVDIKMSGQDNWKNMYGVYSNGKWKNININISDCKISGVKGGIYFPSGGGTDEISKLNVKNTEIFDSSVGIAIKGGSVSIEDTIIRANGSAGTKGEEDNILEKFNPDDIKSGGYGASGEALLLECNYADRGIDVTVSGNCDFNSANGYAVRMQFFKGDMAKTLTINGGNFIGYMGGIYENHSKNVCEYEYNGKKITYGTTDPERFKASFKNKGGTFNPHISIRNK